MSKNKNRKAGKSESIPVEGTQMDPRNEKFINHDSSTTATEPKARKPRKVVIDGEKVVDVATEVKEVKEESTVETTDPTVETAESVVISKDKPVEEVVSGPRIIWTLEPVERQTDVSNQHVWYANDNRFSVARCVSRHSGGQTHFACYDTKKPGTALGLRNSLRNAIQLAELIFAKEKGGVELTKCSNKEEVIAQAALKEIDTLPAKPGQESTPAVVPLNEEQKKEMSEKVKKVLELCETLGLSVSDFIRSQQVKPAKTPATSKGVSNGVSTSQVGRAKVLIFGKYSSVGIVQWMRSHKWTLEDCLKVLPLVGSPISGSTVKSMLKDKNGVAEKKPGPELSDEEETKLEEMRK